MAIPWVVQQKLADGIWHRPANYEINATLERLKISAKCEFAEFYRVYWGPFGSDKTGYELLDLIEDAESVNSSTLAVRNTFEWPSKLLVISNYLAGGVLVYDAESEVVFDVNFEGSDQLLLRGEMQPKWKSWYEFTSFYFG